MANKDVLKKCPFCGHDKLSMGMIQLGINNRRAYFISCMRCDAEGPWSATNQEHPDPWDQEKNTFTYTSEAMEKAIKMWNERKKM